MRAGHGLAWLVSFALLAGCGYRAPLTKVDPELKGAEKKAALAAEKQLVDEGLKVAAETRPVRVDDLTVKLEEQPADPFNLPPVGAQRGKVTPFPGDPTPQPEAR